MIFNVSIAVVVGRMHMDSTENLQKGTHISHLLFFLFFF